MFLMALSRAGCRTLYKDLTGRIFVPALFVEEEANPLAEHKDQLSDRKNKNMHEK